MKIKKSNIEIIKGYMAGERPFVSVGYVPPSTQRKEGEQWVDVHGIKWEQRSGYKVQINEQAKLIREVARQKCVCGQDIQYGDKLDIKMFSKTGKCFDCLIEEETEYRVLGVYHHYENHKLLSNYLGYLKDMKQKIEDSVRYFKKETGDLSILCNSEGFIEKFRGLNTGELLKNAEKDLKEVSDSIVRVMKDKAKAKKLFDSELAKAKKINTPK